MRKNMIQSLKEVMKKISAEGIKPRLDAAVMGGLSGNTTGP